MNVKRDRYGPKGETRLTRVSRGRSSRFVMGKTATVVKNVSDSNGDDSSKDTDSTGKKGKN